MRTYWYDEHTYGFKKKWYESGAWDKKYDMFVEKLRDDLKNLTQKQIPRLEEEISTIKSKTLDEKSSVESMFL